MQIDSSISHQRPRPQVFIPLIDNQVPIPIYLSVIAKEDEEIKINHNNHKILNKIVSTD